MIDLFTILGFLIAILLGVAAYAFSFIKIQGDSDIVLVTRALEIPELGAHSSTTVAHSLVFKNIGKQDGVLLDVRVSAPHTPDVHIEPMIVRKDTDPSELGYWVANILEPGESCEGELTVEAAVSGKGERQLDNLAIDISYDEVGRSPLVTKTARVKLVVPARTVKS